MKEDALGHVAAGPVEMRLEQTADESDVLSVRQRLQPDHVEVAGGGEASPQIEHEGRATAHPGGEVAAGGTEDEHGAAGHIFAAVVAQALDDSQRTAVAHGEALAGHAPKKG